MGGATANRGRKSLLVGVELKKNKNILGVVLSSLDWLPEIQSRVSSSEIRLSSPNATSALSDPAFFSHKPHLFSDQISFHLTKASSLCFRNLLLPSRAKYYVRDGRVPLRFPTRIIMYY